MFTYTKKLKFVVDVLYSLPHMSHVSLQYEQFDFCKIHMQLKFLCEFSKIHCRFGLLDFSVYIYV